MCSVSVNNNNSGAGELVDKYQSAHAHKKWNIHELRKSNNQATILETNNPDYCYRK